MNTEQLERRIKAARGEIPFDSCFYNCRLVNVYTERIVENASIGVIDGVIAAVCPQFKAEAELKIDCGNKFLCPSFIDAHMHIETSHLSPAAYCGGAVPHGTGAIFFDPMQIANAAGEMGIEQLGKMLSDLPLRSFLQFPSRVPAAEGMETAAAFFSPEYTLRMMKKLCAATLGEVNGSDLDNRNTLEKILYAKQSGITVNGHCPGLDSTALSAAVAAGLADDHECEAFEELYQRLSIGMSVMIREGTVEPNSAELLRGVIENDVPTDSLMFCTDDKTPADIKKNGCIDNIVRIAIGLGMSPIRAIKIATLNAARHFGVEGSVGSVSVGRYADFLLLDSLEKINIAQVYFNGSLAAENGRLTTTHSISCGEKFPQLCGTVKLPKNITAEELAVPIEKDCGEFEAIVMKVKAESLITEKSTAVLKSENGIPVPDTKRDILPVAVIERYGKNGNIGRGFINGIDIKRGAVAASLAQEGNNLVVCGADYNDMLAAAREVERIDGGIVVCIDGKIIGEHKLPLAGVMGVGELDDEIALGKELTAAFAETGSANPMLSTYLIVSNCSSIPQLGLTDMGLIDVISHKIISPVLSIIRQV